MANRPARFTLADLRRAIKAAEHSGPDWVVEVAPDGTIRIARDPDRGKEPGWPESAERVLVA